MSRQRPQADQSPLLKRDQAGVDGGLMTSIHGAFNDALFAMGCLWNSTVHPTTTSTSKQRQINQLNNALQYIQNYPSYWRAYERASALQLQLDNPYDAYKLSKQGLKINSRNKNLQKLHRQCQARLQQTHGFQKAAEELWEANQKEEARKAINHAIQQNPDDQQSLILALKIYKASHNKKKSVKLARHLNAQHPNNPESIRFLCEHYQLEKKSRQVLLYAEKGALQCPEDSYYLDTLELIRQEAIDKENEPHALAISKTILNVSETIFKQHSDKEKSFLDFCEALIINRNHPKALAIAKQCLERFPSSQRALQIVCEITFHREEFSDCIEAAEALIKNHPQEASGYEHKSKTLNALGKTDEGLSALLAGLKRIESQKGLRRTALRIDPEPDHQDLSLDIIEKIIFIDPNYPNSHRAKLIHLLAYGLEKVAKHHAKWLLAQKNNAYNDYIFADNRQGKSLNLFASNLSRSRAEVDPLIQSWIHSFRTYIDLPSDAFEFEHQPFQYWSQGSPPDEILRISEKWNNELSKIGLRKIIIFDRSSAKEWICDNIPTLADAFNTAFHYAVEADIFRIAYALKNDCIWIDSDMIPSNVVPYTLANRLLSANTTLYIRTAGLEVSNAFFATQKASPFFKRIADEMKDFSFQGKTPSRSLVLNTFGPKRYENTLLHLIKTNLSPQKTTRGNSSLDFGDLSINLVNKSSFGRSKPREGLAYFETDDNWNNFLNNT